jgi:hypothetical protein
VVEISRVEVEVRDGVVKFARARAHRVHEPNQHVTTMESLCHFDCRWLAVPQSQRTRVRRAYTLTRRAHNAIAL